ncbi:tetratricopeptide repeat protein [Candidatus Poribacteria bacterium]|nr:tetratricopeptide repeat protein [Candidatus Poribacteria bacterium]
MKTLFIAFLVGICCFLSACDVRTRNDQEPITIDFYEKGYYIDGEGYVDNIEKDETAVASKQDPASAETYWNLGTGKLYLEQGELDKAIVKFKKAVQANPGFVEAHYLLTDVYSLKGEGILSRKSLETAMALEGSYIIDTTIGTIDRTHTIIGSTPPAVIRSEEIIELPPEFFEDPGKIGVPRKWESRPK